MLIQGQTVQAVPTARETGSQNAMQLQLGDLGVSEVLPRYAALGWSGQLFYASNTAAQALSVASTTFTGLAVANPANSGKNLVIVDASVALAAAASAVGDAVLGYAAIVALTTGNSTGPGGLSTIVGSANASVAKVGASATLGAAPTVIRPLIGLQWVTAGTSAANVYTKDEVAGVILVPPGQLICIESLVAAMTVVASITWAELPV